MAAPNIQFNYCTDSEHFKVIYNQEVVNTTGANGALRPSNYSISPSLSVISVTRLVAGSNPVYLIQTARQVKNLKYTVTITNVENLSGEVVTDPIN